MATFSNMISVFFFVFFVSIASSNPPGNDLQTKLTESINHFSTDLFKVVSQDNEHAGKNLVMSAMSADIALAMLSLGATGKTLKEMNDGLHLPNSTFTKAAYKPAIDKMNTYQEVTFNMTNKVYVGEEYTLAPVYKNAASQLFGSEVENIDFSHNTAAAAKINSWIKDKTNQTIKKVVKATDFDSTTALVLVNTIYFKGAWSNKFILVHTSEISFYVNATNTIPIKMKIMVNDTKYGESAELDAQILEMAFEGNEMSMVFILPNKVDGLAALEKKLTDDYANFQASLDGLQTELVTIQLPMLKIETTALLNDALSKLGMNTMFSDNAELGGLLVNPLPFKVSKVIQKAFIDLNEEEVTASAATVIGTSGSKRQLPYLKVFSADHPFYYALVNSDKQTVFSGHFTGEN